MRVDAAVRAHALHHLWQYEQERQVPRVVEPELTQQPHAWLGSAVYALLLLAVPVAVSQGWLRDPYAIGVLDPGRIRSGEWWRAVTALTLHWDMAHLLGNLGAGVLLGHAAAQIWGNARAWLLVLMTAVAANLLEAQLGSGYVSAGASTAVFAALGLVSAWSWRTRRRYAHNAMRRWVPLMAGIAVLALFGAGDAEPTGNDHTNVLSHALGFAMGAIAGVLVATERGDHMLRRLPVLILAAVSVSLVVIAWLLALMMSVSESVAM